MQIRFLALLVSLLSSYAFAASSAAGKSAQKDITIPGACLFIDSFDSMEDFLDGLVSYRIIDAGEKTAVLDVLKKNEIPLSKGMIHPRITGSTLTWGTLSLKIAKDGAIEYQGKTLIRAGEELHFDEAFLRILNETSHVKSAGVFEFLIHSAHAGVASTVFEAVGAASYGAFYHTMNTTSTVTQVLGAAVMNGVGFPLETILVGLRDMIYKGTVTCSYGGRYVFHGGFKQLNWTESFEGWKRFEVGQHQHPDPLNGYSANLSAVFMAGGELIGSTFNPGRAADVPIDAKRVKKAWPNQDVPNCDKDNAAKLEASLKDQAKVIDNQIKAAGGPNPAGTGTDRGAVK